MMKFNKDLAVKVLGVIATAAGVISTVDGLYSNHKEKQDAKNYKEKVDRLEKAFEELQSKK